jgi:uncharacterized cupin superfamily protein
MDKSPDTDMTFFRVGEMPGSRRQMMPARWPKGVTPLSDGMSPFQREFYSDGAGRLKCGVWQCNAGTIELCGCAADRVCFILRGTVRLTDHQEHSEAFGVGECFVIPRGFNGVWSQSDDFAMTYVLIDEDGSVQQR